MSDTIDISIDNIRALLLNAATQVVSTKEAAYFADELIETHIRKCNVSNPIKSGIADLEACLNNADKKIVRNVDLAAYVSIDFNSHGPLPYIKNIHDDLEKKSSECGIAMASFKNSQSMHTLHNWVQGLAKRGLVAIAVCNGGPAAVVPFNGTKGVFGTNPMAFALPGNNDDIHCIDMATSEVAYFEIMNAKAENRSLRENVAVDQNGNPTTDPSKALDYSKSETDPVSNLLPLGGGYKGYYLVYLLEILTSGLIGSKSSPEMAADFVAEEHGSFILVLNPKAMGTDNLLLQSIIATHKALEETPAKLGKEIHIPGNGNNKRYQESKTSNINIDAPLLKRLEALQN